MDKSLTGMVPEKVMKEISQEFIRLHGKNTICLSVYHNEKHPHNHILVSGCDLSGYSSRISKQKFNSLRISLDRCIELNHPELHRGASLSEQRQKLTPDQIIEKAKINRQTNKALLIEKLQKIYEVSQSKDHFLQQLKKDHIETYERVGKLGVVVNGRKFRLSRLGYDEAQLDELEMTVERNELDKLDDLRHSMVQQQIKEEQIIETPKQETDLYEQTLLDEIEAARNGKYKRELLKDATTHEKEVEAEIGHEQQVDTFPQLEFEH